VTAHAVFVMIAKGIGGYLLCDVYRWLTYSAIQLRSVNKQNWLIMHGVVNMTLAKVATQRTVMLSAPLSSTVSTIVASAFCHPSLDQTR
jgi:hypothetical protein